MGLTVTYHNPDFPDGTEVGIDGLGLLKNGEAVEISTEQEQAFANQYQKTVTEIYEGSELLTVEGEATVEGPEEQTGTQMPDEDEEAASAEEQEGEAASEEEEAETSSER